MITSLLYYIIDILGLLMQVTIVWDVLTIACVYSWSRPRFSQTSRSPTCPSSPTSSRPRCLPPLLITRSCLNGKRRSHCFVSLTLALTRPVSTTSVLPASDPLTTRGAPSSRSLVSSAGKCDRSQIPMWFYFSGLKYSERRSHIERDSWSISMVFMSAHPSVAS